MFPSSHQGVVFSPIQWIMGTSNLHGSHPLVVTAGPACWMAEDLWEQSASRSHSVQCDKERRKN